MLQNYPDLIDRLQWRLNEVVTKPKRSTEIVVWTLQDLMDGFLGRAEAELAIPKKQGGAEQARLAKANVGLILRASASGDGMRLSLMEGL